MTTFPKRPANLVTSWHTDTMPIGYGFMPERKSQHSCGPFLLSVEMTPHAIYQCTCGQAYEVVPWSSGLADFVRLSKRVQRKYRRRGIIPD